MRRVALRGIRADVVRFVLSFASATGPVIVRWAGGAVLALHGLIHLMGVVLLWKLGQPGDLRYADMSPVAGSVAGLAVGVVWLAGAALFVFAAALLVSSRSGWRAAALAAVVLSVPVLGPSASMASAGLVVDAAVLLFVILTSGSARPVPHQPVQES
jgi:hypothetical protein